MSSWKRKYDRNQPRRWASVFLKHRPDMTELYVTPDEARTALIAALSEVGVRLDKVLEYDPRTDRFTCLCIRYSDGKRVDCELPGETVAKIVRVARTMWKMPKGLVRPSDIPATKEGYAMLQDMLNASGEH
jgi:hypothetical protein